MTVKEKVEVIIFNFCSAKCSLLEFPLILKMDGYLCIYLPVYLPVCLSLTCHLSTCPPPPDLLYPQAGKSIRSPGSANGKLTKMADMIQIIHRDKIISVEEK